MAQDCQSFIANFDPTLLAGLTIGVVVTESPVPRVAYNRHQLVVELFAVCAYHFEELLRRSLFENGEDVLGTAGHLVLQIATTPAALQSGGHEQNVHVIVLGAPTLLRVPQVQQFSEGGLLLEEAVQDGPEAFVGVVLALVLDVGNHLLNMPNQHLQILFSPLVPYSVLEVAQYLS